MKTTAYFDGDNIQGVIADELNNAKKSIYVAVAWLTDELLIDILKSKAEAGLDVVVIYNDDKINQQGKIGIAKFYNVKIYPISESLMHHKFCIIDNYTVVSGSYNWTKKASNNNIENIKVTTGDTSLVKQYFGEFNNILKKHHNIEINSTLYIPRTSNTRFYKFNNEEFYDVSSLTMYFISNTEYWKDALIHYKNNFITEWMQSINDFDTIVQLDKFKSKYNNSSEEEELFFVTIYANPTFYFKIETKWLYFFGETEEIENITYIYNDFIRFEKLLQIYIDYSKNTDVVNYVKQVYRFLKIFNGQQLPPNFQILYHTYMHLEKRDFFTYQGEILNINQLNDLLKISDLKKINETYYVPGELKKRLYSKDFEVYSKAARELKDLDTHEQHEIKKEIAKLPEAEQELLKIVETYNYILPEFLKQKIIKREISASEIELVDYPSKNQLLSFLQKSIIFKYYKPKVEFSMLAEDDFSVNLRDITNDSNKHKRDFNYFNHFNNEFVQKIHDLNSGFNAYDSIYRDEIRRIIGVNIASTLKIEELKDIDFNFPQLNNEYEKLYNKLDFFWRAVIRNRKLILPKSELDKYRDRLIEINYKIYKTGSENYTKLQNEKQDLINEYRDNLIEVEVEIRNQINKIINEEKRLMGEEELRLTETMEKKETDNRLIEFYLKRLEEKIDKNNYEYYSFNIQELDKDLIYYDKTNMSKDGFWDFFRSKKLLEYNINKVYLFRQNLFLKLSKVAKFDENFVVLSELAKMKTIHEYSGLQLEVIKKYNEILIN